MCFWLKYGRRVLSWEMNVVLQRYRRPLPVVKTIDDVEEALVAITYVPDKTDWIQRPELTWGLRTGDCEDFAALAMALLKQIGIKGYLLSVICQDRRLSHAVCAFSSPDGTYSYFSNARLESTQFSRIEDVVSRIGGRQVVCWSLEDSTGKVRSTKCLSPKKKPN